MLGDHGEPVGGDEEEINMIQIQKIKKNIFKLQKKHEDISRNIYK